MVRAVSSNMLDIYNMLSHVYELESNEFEALNTIRHHYGTLIHCCSNILSSTNSKKISKTCYRHRCLPSSFVSSCSDCIPSSLFRSSSSSPSDGSSTVVPNLRPFAKWRPFQLPIVAFSKIAKNEKIYTLCTFAGSCNLQNN